MPVEMLTFEAGKSQTFITSLSTVEVGKKQNVIIVIVRE